MKKSELEKHQDMEGERKGNGHEHGRKSRIPEPVLIVWKLAWAHGTLDGWMDGWTQQFIFDYKFCEHCLQVYVGQWRNQSPTETRAADQVDTNHD